MYNFKVSGSSYSPIRFEFGIALEQTARISAGKC